MSFLLFLLYFVTLSCDTSSRKFQEEIINYSNTTTFVINQTVEYILEFQPEQVKNLPPRVTVISENSIVGAPLMIVARQPRYVVSWQLPLIIESDSGNTFYTKTSRTLCHDLVVQNNNNKSLIENYNPTVGISTMSTVNTSFTIHVDYQEQFFLVPSVEYKFTITPSEPRFFFYNFSTNISESRDSNYEMVILEVFSDNSVCMTVSIQNATCPVFDTNEDITFRGFYETVDTQGGITIPKEKFPYGFYVVFVAKPDNSDCTGVPTKIKQDQIKNITLIIKPSISYRDYINAVIVTLSCIVGFYFIFGLGFCFCSSRIDRPRLMEYVSDDVQTPTTSCNEIVDSISVDESEFDTIREIESDKVIRLGKSNLYLTDLARKDPRVLKQKSYLYLYNVLTVALFYGLPVVQLVVTYQSVLNETGQQDLCYYNFLCAHPLGVISDFNHLFSNIGYILLGILFLWITYRREITHKDIDFDRQYGIPQHYGMFYAMGVALIMEGVLSGSYHICPNQANFQFDSSFMYVMAVLCMVKLYQNRHPDINATAYTTFGVLAIAILLGMIGILEGNLIFWITFTVIYLFSCFYMSAQIYYMGCWKLDCGLLIRVYRTITYDFWSGPLNVLKPIYPARMCLLIIGNLCNWCLAFWGVYLHQKDFALFLLTVFMGNTLLYFFFYVFMKVWHKEHVNKLSLFFLFISALCAVSAMHFFLQKSISWSKSPSQSRQFNQECKLWRFYDYHDIWHFLSAIGMFFTFMVLLTLDDDLSHTHRSQIPVF